MNFIKLCELPKGDTILSHIVVKIGMVRPSTEEISKVSVTAFDEGDKGFRNYFIK